MQELFKSLGQELEAGRPAMLCTIIESHGSAPRRAGARMLLLQGGRALGTVGGGIMEHLVQQKGWQELPHGRSFVEFFSLAPGQAASIGMVCGGSVRILFQHCAAKDGPFFQKVAQLLDGDADIWLSTRFAGETWQAGLYDGSGSLLAGNRVLPAGAAVKPQAFLSEAEGEMRFTDPLSRSGLLYIFGGGHISQELVPVLAHVGFRPIIFEDRPEFAQAALFPGVVKTVLGDFADFGSTITVRRQDYIAIMTRGHAADHEVLVQALRTPAQYIGLIGSRSKMGHTVAKLLDAGFTTEDIGRIHNPIGIPIGAETPAEIAISIAGELIRHRAGGSC